VLLLSQFLIGAKLESEPAAGRILQNCLNYLAGFRPAAGGTALVAADPAFRTYLDSLGLRFDDLTGKLAGADLRYAALDSADMTSANLTAANLWSASLSHAILANANLSGADLTYASLSGADLTNAQVAGAKFARTILSQQQLYSTASYRAKDLHGIALDYDNLNGWSFAGQNLTGASL
jgi:uncharacterized protein YjbI with pentapeptide repeats